MRHDSDAQRMASWLSRAASGEASDLHVVAGFPPTLRVHGELIPLQKEPLGPDETRGLLSSICEDEVFEEFLRKKNLDFAPVVDLTGSENSESDGARFRANFFIAGGQTGGCFRVIPSEIPDMQWAGFPTDLADRILGLRNGLVLFTGVTGSGKSTSLAMMIRRILGSGGQRIVTIEDPIEYSFDQADGSLVSQREVGRDVDSFSDGLRFALRQDPDVILVGEVRDHETARIALSAAETGHLIFSTLHTRDAKGAVSRFTDLFPPQKHYEVRSQLALSLRCVVSQHLLPSSIPGEKRELALEVMLHTSAIAAAIRMGKMESIDNCIQTSRADGMYLLDDSVSRLWSEGRITEETAQRFVSDIRNLRRMQ